MIFQNNSSLSEITGGMRDRTGDDTDVERSSKKIEMGRGLTFYLSSVKKPPGLQILISINIGKDLTFWLPGWCSGKESPCNAGDVSLIPGSGRSPKQTATHSSVLAWEISGTEEPGGLQSMGLQRGGHG